MKMKPVTKKIITACAFILFPVVLTGLFKFTDHSIGPYTFYYSIFVGVLAGFKCGAFITKKLNWLSGIPIGILVGYVIMILFVNYFYGVTNLMGECDYFLS